MNSNARKDRDGLHRRPKAAQGIWYFYYRGADGNWHEKSTGTRNYSQARLIRTEELEKVRRGEFPSEMADCILRDAAELWLGQQRTLVLPVTFSGYHWVLQPLLKAFGGKKLKDISVPMVRAYQAERAALASSRTVNRELQTLMTILNQAKMGGALAEIKPLRKRTSVLGRALSQEEERRLFATAASRPAWEAVFSLALLAANTGLRSGEVRRLRIGDVSLETQAILVHRGATKTDGGERVIPLNTSALLAARFLIDRAVCLGASAPEHFLLPANLSKRTTQAVHSSTGFDPTQHQRSWRTAWRRLTRTAGLRGLRFHDLRHHFITRLAEANVPIQVAMSLAGHMSMEMTRHYTHISDRTRRDAVNAIACNVFPKLSGSRLLVTGADAVQAEVSRVPVLEVESIERTAER